MSVAQHAEDLYAQLRDKGLPWWSQRVDDEHGGYVLGSHEKQLATQSRMVWAFSHAYRNGLGDYLGAAESGIEFLLQHFFDRESGGFLWKTDLAGRPLDERKFLYGHVFAMYAFVEYGRAARNGEAVGRALTLFRVLRERAHDDEFGGWLEHFARDWQPITTAEVHVDVEIAGLKSANSHLHTLEALAELYAETRDADVGEALTEAAEICTSQFYPDDPWAASQHRTRDWKPAGHPGVSVGHNVQFAWLMTRAETSLGSEPTWERLDAYLSQALADRDDVRVWWETAETLAALATAIANRQDPAYLAGLDRLLTFAVAHQIDPADGLWLYSVAHDGTVVNPAKVETWKDAYHDLRATILLAKAFRQFH
jgi:mannobiose 2-epimerase